MYFLFNILCQVYYCVLLVNSILYIKKEKYSSMWQRTICYYIWSMLILEIISNLQISNNLNNYSITILYFILHFYFLSLFYRQISSNVKLVRKIKITTVLLLPLYTLPFFFDNILLSAFVQFSGNFLIIIYGLVIFYDNIDKTQHKLLINVGIIIFCFLQIVINNFSQIIIHFNYQIIELSLFIAIINLIINISLQVVFFIDRLKYLKKEKYYAL